MYVIEPDLVPTAVIGGTMLGAASVVLWLGIGRMAAVSGIIARWSSFNAQDRGWRLAFLGGVILTPAAYELAWGVPAIPSPVEDPLRMLAAGFLVGLGSRMANGCTTGHGICGLGRLSPRSLFAIALMVVTAAGVVAATHMLQG